MTKSKGSLHWCRSISKNICAGFITVSVKKLLHYRAGGLLQYRAVLLHYRAVITLSGVFYYIIGQLLQYRAFITLSVGTGLSDKHDQRNRHRRRYHRNHGRRHCRRRQQRNQPATAHSRYREQEMPTSVLPTHTCSFELRRFEESAPTSPLIPVNNWLHSLFSQVDVYLNDTLVTPSSNTYPFRASVDTVLSYAAPRRRILHLQASCGTRTPPDTWMPRPWVVAMQVWLNDEGTKRRGESSR